VASVFVKTEKVILRLAESCPEHATMLRTQIKFHLATALRMMEKKALPWFTTNLLVAVADHHAIAVPVGECIIMLRRRTDLALSVVATAVSARFPATVVVEHVEYNLKQFLGDFLLPLSNDFSVTQQWPLLVVPDLLTAFSQRTVSGEFPFTPQGDSARSWIAQQCWGCPTHTQGVERSVKTAGRTGHANMADPSRRASQLLATQSKDESYRIQRKAVADRQRDNPKVVLGVQAYRFRPTKSSNQSLLAALDKRRVTAAEVAAAPRLSDAQQLAKAERTKVRVAEMRSLHRTGSRKKVEEVKELECDVPEIPPCVEGKQLVSSLKTMVDRQKCCEALSISLPPTGERYHASLRLIKLYCVVNQQYQADSRKPHDATKWKHWVHNAAATIDVDLLELEDISVDALNVNEILGD
jgi:hypothetical protein